MSRYESNDASGPAYTSETSSFLPTSSSHRISRGHKQQRRRHDRTESQPQSVAYEVPLGPPHIVLSPPLENGYSPPTEIALLPGGGVEIPFGFRFTEAHDRTHRHDLESGSHDEPRGTGGFGLGMLRGLKKIPGAIIRAGRGAIARPDVSHIPDRPEERHNLPVDEDVETYVTYNEDNEDEGRMREDQLLREYIQRHRMRRDRTYGNTNRVRRENYVPAPQPVPIPGSSPVPSAVARSEAPLTSALEAEEIAAEGEAFTRAQERERARRIYTGEVVKPSSSYVSYASKSRHHRRAPSAPLPTRVFSNWAAERDSRGRRLENYADDMLVPSTSPLTLTGLMRLMQQIRDMPWVGERVAADYIPGGLRSPASEYTSTTVYSTSATGTSYVSPAPVLPPPPGQSWYAPRDEFLVLPEGVPPPPGFIPYPDEYPFPSEVDDRALNDSSQTHIEMPVPVHYVESETYQFVPAEASVTGQPRISVPTQH